MSAYFHIKGENCDRFFDLCIPYYSRATMESKKGNYYDQLLMIKPRKAYHSQKPRKPYQPRLFNAFPCDHYDELVKQKKAVNCSK